MAGYQDEYHQLPVGVKPFSYSFLAKFGLDKNAVRPLSRSHAGFPRVGGSGFKIQNRGDRGRAFAPTAPMGCGGALNPGGGLSLAHWGAPNTDHPRRFRCSTHESLAQTPFMRENSHGTAA